MKEYWELGEAIIDLTQIQDDASIADHNCRLHSKEMECERYKELLDEWVRARERLFLALKEVG
jgi:hypothetical protein